MYFLEKNTFFRIILFIKKPVKDIDTCGYFSRKYGTLISLIAEEVGVSKQREGTKVVKSINLEEGINKEVGRIKEINKRGGGIFAWRVEFGLKY